MNVSSNSKTLTRSNFRSIRKFDKVCHHFRLQNLPRVHGCCGYYKTEMVFFRFIFIKLLHINVKHSSTY